MCHKILRVIRYVVRIRVVQTTIFTRNFLERLGERFGTESD